ncbi:MAG: ribonuclease P protein component [Patescibacteria group bacterium]
MIPSNRKVGTRLFKDILEKGKSFHSESFSLRTVSLGSQPARFSVVVSKKIEKRAVQRNFMKRRMYALIRPYLSKAKSGLQAVFFLKKKIAKDPIEKLKTEIEAVFKKAAITG